MKFLASCALTVAFLALLAPVIGGAAEASADGLVYRVVSPTSQECPASESVVYEWFVYNGDNVTYLLELSRSPASGAGWDSEFVQTIFVLAPGESVFINMSVSASGEISSKTVYQNITLQFTDLGNLSEPGTTITSTIHTDMIPTWGVIAPGKNKLLGRFDNPLPSPLDGNYVTFAINIGIWAAIALIFAFVIDPAVHLFTRRTRTDLDDRVVKILRKPMFVLVIIYGLVSSFSILQLSEGEVSLIFEFYGIILIAILTFVVYKVFKEILIFLGKRWASRTATEIDDVLIPVIEKVGGIVILIFGAIGIVNYMGYDITFLLAGVGVFGLVIAFAAQDALSNFFSGIFMLLDRPFVEGDFVQITTGELCRVEKIGIRSTRLYDVFQNNYIVLPNNKLVNDKIVNLTEPDKQGVAEIVVKVPHGTDTQKVEKLLTDIAKSNKDVLQTVGKEPLVRLSDISESGQEFKLFVWVGDFMDKWRVAHELRKEVTAKFAKQGIDLELVPRTLYLKKSDGK